MRNKVYLSLVHYPVYNRNKDIVCTSVTNFDIHDISRSCGTYEIKGYRLVVPVDAQKKLTERIIAYWQDGTGGQYNKDREQAFKVTDVVESIEDVVKEIEKIEGQKPLIITTSARTFNNSISYKDLSKQIFEDDKPYLLLFGTGWGLTDIDFINNIVEAYEGAGVVRTLDPIKGIISVISTDDFKDFMRDVLIDLGNKWVDLKIIEEGAWRGTL